MNDAGEGGYCIVFANPTAYCTYKLEALKSTPRHQKKKTKISITPLGALQAEGL